VTDTFVASGCARLAAQESHGCQRNSIQNASARHTLTLAPPLYGSRPNDRRDRPCNVGPCMAHGRCPHAHPHMPWMTLKSLRRPYSRHISSIIASAIHLHASITPYIRCSLLSTVLVKYIRTRHIPSWNVIRKPSRSIHHSRSYQHPSSYHRSGT
jgi:hypothetical protein